MILNLTIVGRTNSRVRQANKQEFCVEAAWHVSAMHALLRLINLFCAPFHSRQRTRVTYVTHPHTQQQFYACKDPPHFCAVNFLCQLSE